MYLSLLAPRPAAFVVSRPLLEGRRVFDAAAGAWVLPASQTWGELWQRVPRFRRIWRVCTVIWGTAILADAVIRVAMAFTLPIGLVPALGGALWPVTFIAAGRHEHLLRAIRVLAHPQGWRPGQLRPLAPRRGTARKSAAASC